MNYDEAKKVLTDTYLTTGQKLLSYCDIPKSEFRRNSCIELIVENANGSRQRSVVNGSVSSLVQKINARESLDKLTHRFKGRLL